VRWTIGFIFGNVNGPSLNSTWELALSRKKEKTSFILSQYVVMCAEISAPLTKIAVCEYAYTMSKAYFGKAPPSTNLNGWFK
jgi:hypothetical protein